MSHAWRRIHVICVEEDTGPVILTRREASFQANKTGAGHDHCNRIRRRGGQRET
jgi:hypothetical protein